jgi:glutamate formiminotransferase/formiminotetrahydrofolate cyclodeaminase
MEVPFETARLAVESMDIIAVMVNEGLASSTTDAGVGALCARTAVLGAAMNVRVNAKTLKDQVFAQDLVKRVKELSGQAEEKEAAIRRKLEEGLD